MNDMLLLGDPSRDGWVFEVHKGETQRFAGLLVFANFYASDGTEPAEVLSKCGYRSEMVYLRQASPEDLRQTLS